MLSIIFEKVTFPVSGVETYWWFPGIVAFVISFFTSMGGLSGAFLLLPFQVSILGFASPSVTPTNLIFNMIAIPGGVYRYIREKRMIWPLAAITIAGTLPGILIGAFMRIYWLSDPNTFKLFVGLVLLYICIRLINDLIGKKKNKDKVGAGKFEVTLRKFNLTAIEYSFVGSDYHISTPIMFVVAFVVGIIGGAYGIGGGAIISPFVVAVFGLPVHTVAGAALLGTLVTSVAGVAIYQFILPLMYSGYEITNPDWLLGLSFGIGGLFGIYLGARSQKYFQSKFIKIIMIISIGIIVARYIGGYIINMI